jgi:hypothetical protein
MKKLLMYISLLSLIGCDQGISGEQAASDAPAAKGELEARFSFCLNGQPSKHRPTFFAAAVGERGHH